MRKNQFEISNSVQISGDVKLCCVDSNLYLVTILKPQHAPRIIYLLPKGVEMMLKTENESIREAGTRLLLLERITHRHIWIYMYIYIVYVYIYGTTERFETRQSIFETIIRQLLHECQSKLL